MPAASGTPTAGARRNPRGKGSRLRTALMDAASDALLEVGGAEKFSIRAITARAGVTPTALYLHFADKDELLVAVLARSFEQLRGFVNAAERKHHGDPKAQLLAMLGAYIAFARERPGHYRLIFGTDVPGGTAARENHEPDCNSPGQLAFDDLVRAIARARGDDRDPFQAAILVWTALHGFITLQPVIPNFPWPPAEDFVEALYATGVRTIITFLS